MTETIDGQLVVGFTPIVLRGDPGPKGDKGDPGAGGAVPDLTIGTVANGASASASITGSTSNPVLNLTLPVADLTEFQTQLGTIDAAKVDKTNGVTATITGDPADPDVTLYMNGVEL